MYKRRYPLNLIKAGYKMLEDMGFTQEEIKQIRSERRRIIEAKISTYVISGSQLSFYRQQIEMEREKMSSVGSPVLSDMPKGPFNPMATQDKWAACIDKINAWETKLSALEQEKAQIEKGMKLLQPMELVVLKQHYGFDSSDMKSMPELVEETCYSKRQLFRYMDNALEILAFSILGPVERAEHIT